MLQHWKQMTYDMMMTGLDDLDDLDNLDDLRDQYGIFIICLHPPRYRPGSGSGHCLGQAAAPR